MSRINTNVTSLIAQRVLNQNNTQLNQSLERLSTGLKINSGADDPAGLIASQNLQAEQAGITQAIDNANRANNIIGTAEGGLSEVSNLLTQLQSLVSASANSGGLSNDEIQANQLQVDSILNTVNRIAQSTSFQGKKLLNGNYDYTTSGVTSTSFSDVQVNSARIPQGSTIDVTVAVTASAQTGAVNYTGGTLTAPTKIEVAGNAGTEQLSFSSGTTISAIAAAINTVTTATGVSATINGSNIKLNSQDFGSDQFVGIKTISGTFTTDTAKDFGTDAAVTVNGTAAQVNGLAVSSRSSNLDLSFNLATANNKVGSGSFEVTGGGATFAFGSKVSEGDKASIGIQSVSTGSLGDKADGFLTDLASGGTANLATGNLIQAQNIVSKAINQVSELRGRLGAFQKFTIGSTVNALGVAFENVSASESDITDTNFAQETANLTRAQILQSAATTVLSQANSAPQAALSLLNR